MNLEDVTTQQLLKALASRYKHIGFVGIPKDSTDPGCSWSENKSVVDRLMVEAIVRPSQVKSILSEREEWHGVDFQLSNVPDEQRAMPLLGGLGHIYPEFVFGGYPKEGTQPTVLVSPDPRVAAADAKQHLIEVKQSITSMPVE